MTPSRTRMTGDHGLPEVIQATVTLISGALEISEDGNVDKSVLEYLQRLEFGGGELAQKRFGRLYDSKKPETAQKYIKLWTQALCFIWRTVDKHPSQRAAYEISRRAAYGIRGLPAASETHSKWHTRKPSDKESSVFPVYDSDRCTRTDAAQDAEKAAFDRPMPRVNRG